MKILLAGIAILSMLTVLPIRITWARHPISGGIVIINNNIPSEGIKVSYKYIDKTSGSFGSDYVTLKNGFQMHLLQGSADVDSGFYIGDKVVMTVSRYTDDLTRLNPHDPFIDKQTITLGETGGIFTFNLLNATSKH